MPARAWRDSTTLQSPTLGLLIVLLTAALLRVWGLSAGIPYAVGIDEPEIVVRAVHMMKTGDFHPRFYDYPGLYIYAQLVVACARFLTGGLTGRWHSLDQATPDDFYLWGRALTALVGTLTVVIVFRIGGRWGARHALLAAGLMAVLPWHVRESHYVLTDVPLTFFVALSCLLSLRAYERPTLGRFAWAGAAVGLAAATKYNGLVAGVMPLTAAWMAVGAVRPRWQLACVALAATGSAFVLGAPYSVLDLPAFLNGFASLAATYRHAVPPGEPIWLIYAKHLRNGLKWPGLLVVGAGLVMATMRAVRGPGQHQALMLVAFPAAYFWLIANQRIVYGRYLLPLLPFVALLAAVAVISGVSLLRRFDIPRVVRTTMIAALTVTVVLPPAVTAIQFDRMISGPDTRKAAFEWIGRNVPAGSGIAVEGRVILLPEGRYRVHHLRKLIGWNAGRYLETDVRYLVASQELAGRSLTAADSPESAAYRDLFARAQILAAFRQAADRSGPTLTIYRLEH